jgi:hypothetical protein
MDKAIKEIIKSIGSKLLILLSISISFATIIAYFDGVNFFSIMKVMGVLFVIAGVAGFLPSERAAIGNYQNPNMLTEDKYYAKSKRPYYERMLKGNMIVFSKGAMQVIIAAVLTIGFTFFLEGITKTKVFTEIFGNAKIKTISIAYEKSYSHPLQTSIHE